MKDRTKYKKRWYRKNRQRTLAVNKKWWKINGPRMKKCRRQYHLRTNYGLTVEEFWKLHREQNHRCLICKRRHKPKLVVDHNHETGEVRGLLCPKCNRGLGDFDDSILLLESAIKYLSQ